MGASPDADTSCMRITIRVKPGSARPGVGGEHDGALIVRVSARAVDGKATEAALAAVAESFGIRSSAVRLVSGASSRTKVIDVGAVDPLMLAALLATPGRLLPRHGAAVARPPVMSVYERGTIAPFLPYQGYRTSGFGRAPHVTVIKLRACQLRLLTAVVALFT